MIRYKALINKSYDTNCKVWIVWQYVKWKALYRIAEFYGDYSRQYAREHAKRLNALDKENSVNKFHKGQDVVNTKLARRQLRCGRLVGTVMTNSRDPRYVSVLVEGHRSPTYYATFFWTHYRRSIRRKVSAK